MSLDFALSPELVKIQRMAREMASEFARRAPEHDRNRTAPVENYELLRDAGFYGLVIPQKYGGKGLGFMAWVLAAEELAKGCAATALSFNMHINATGAIMSDPGISEAMKQWVADQATQEGKLFCTSVSEPTASSHLAPSYVPTVMARKVPGGYQLFGRKAFASMWEASDLAFLYAHLEDDPNPQSAIGFAAPTDGDGINVEDVWHTVGMRATRSQTVLFDGAFVPDEQVLHTTENFIGSFLMQGAAWSFGGYTGVYLGVGAGIVDFAKQLLSTRQAKGFAQPMGYHPDIRRRMTEMVCSIDQARLVLWNAGWMQETQGASPATFLAFLKAKYAVGEAVTRTAQHAAVACGVHSLFQAQPLERMIRDAMTAPIMPPNADACAGMIGLLEMGLSPEEALPPLRPM
ncbi:MAG: acyl-CoA dehydrogenase [Symbiobacteriaceae bacterium]|jgi:alkylation response protein AidB-like acyl-CoA dehydrogenase|nr:acyl-CoA dehydrogenase [Symbiobacteriaceae bacterium]